MAKKAEVLIKKKFNLIFINENKIKDAPKTENQIFSFLINENKSKDLVSFNSIDMITMMKVNLLFITRVLLNKQVQSLLGVAMHSGQKKGHPIIRFNTGA